MPKKYFTRYLPVEGEITITKDTEINRNTPIFNMHNTLVYYDYHIMLGWKGVRIAKLFLCSRDINFGDKFFFKNDPVEMENKGSLDNDSRYWCSDGKTLYSKNESYKVIGEISPEAIWAKEGDEFDEEGWRCADGNLVFSKIKALRKKNGLEYSIQIKGPCGHFH